MDQRVRVFLADIAGVQVVVGLMFILDVALASALWPVPGTGPMIRIFIACAPTSSSVPSSAHASRPPCRTPGRPSGAG